MSNFTNIINGAGATAQGREGTTIQTFVISLSAGFILFGVQFSTFLIVRNYLWSRRIYQPRSFLIPLKDRVKPPPNNPLRWLSRLYEVPVRTEVLQKAGMDAYFFLRYLSMCLKIFFPLAFLTLPILIPLNVVNGKYQNTIGGIEYNVTGLDRLAWSNVSPANTERYWAHLILALIAIGWVFYLFHYELTHYIVVRREYLSSQSHRLKASSTTVLITDIPKELCTTSALTDLYDDFPGGVRRIWINRNYKDLAEKDERRKEIEDLLENAETDLIRTVVKQNRKKHGGGQDVSAPESTAFDADTQELRTISETKRRDSLPETNTKDEHTTLARCEQDLQHDLATKALWTQFVHPWQRPTMPIPKDGYAILAKIPLLGRLFCHQVDAIYYCRRELARLNKAIDTDIDHAHSCHPNGSAFIQFNTQKAAHLACQAVAHPLPRRMSPRSVEISPADINWPSLNNSWTTRTIRMAIFVFLFLIVLVVYGAISFFTGVLSRVSLLAGSTSWLHWIGTLPGWFLSFIQGTLPPFIQVIVMSGPTPIVLRAMTNNIRGANTGSEGERSLQLWYFVFLLFEIFLIPTISTGLTSLVQDLIQSPTSVSNILATNLPSASNYYFSFLILQALSISSSSILQTVRLFNYYVVGGANTPDRVFRKLTFTHLTRIGSNIPWYTTFAVIGLSYCIVAPLIVVFVLITFGLFYIVIKNNLMYVVRTGNVDSGGLWFPSAINQTFTGIYFMEACLIGLFFVVRDLDNNVACKSQGTIMGVCVVITILYQGWLASTFRGLLTYAPLRLEGAAELPTSADETQHLAPGVQTDLPTSASTVTDTDQVDEQPLVHAAAHIGSTRPRRNTKLSIDQTVKFLERAKSVTTVSRSAELQIHQDLDREEAKRILARINRPLDEKRLAELESKLSVAQARSRRIIPNQKDIEAQMMNDPISKIIMQHNDELEDLDLDERDMLVSVAFTHPLLREPTPVVWIPSDGLGVSDDEVKRTRELFNQSVAIDNRGAYLNKQFKVEVDKPPPDMSEFALVMAEL